MRKNIKTAEGGRDGRWDGGRESGREKYIRFQLVFKGKQTNKENFINEIRKDLGGRDVNSE